MDLISGRIPNAHEIAGIRIVDKSRSDPLIRLEVWMNFNNADSDPRGDAIKNFIFQEYLRKNELPTADVLKFENHDKH